MLCYSEAIVSCRYTLMKTNLKLGGNIMPEKTFELGEAIKIAINLEKNGRKFYMQAAEKSTSESGKKIFTMLAQEEVLHLATFEKMLRTISQAKPWRELIKDYPQARQVPVFNVKGSVKDVPRERADELEAIRMAMKQERKAIDFFDKVAHLASDETTQKVFDFVRQQEVYHYDLLQAQYDSITNTGFWFEMPEFRMDGKI